MGKRETTDLRRAREISIPTWHYGDSASDINCITVCRRGLQRQCS